MRYVGGIDPGLRGAVAVLDLKKNELHVWDTPTYAVKVNGKERKRCDEHAYLDALTAFPLDVAMIEKVQSTPNDGHVGAFTFGKVTGVAIGLCIGAGIELEEVTPAKWKMMMNVPADKDMARQRASMLFPRCVDMWRRQMDDGRAEAALIALYAAISYEVSPSGVIIPGMLNGKLYEPRIGKKR